MDRPPTPKRGRPHFPRSQSSSNVPPPSKATSTTQNAAKKLHLHAFQNSYERAAKHAEKQISSTGSSLQMPAHTIAEKISSRGSGGKQGSNASSRRSSIPPASEAEAAPIKPSTKPVRIQDVAREKQRNAQRNQSVLFSSGGSCRTVANANFRELHKSLDSLSGLARESTQKLDSLYYSILEKVSTLRSGITRLQELSSATTSMQHDFQSNADRVETDFEGQIVTTQNFTSQQRQVEVLESRIKASVDKAARLSDRLEAARKRVDLWEERENEWQARTTLRLRIGWSCLGTLLAVLIVLLALKLLSKSSITGFEMPRNESNFESRFSLHGNKSANVCSKSAPGSSPLPDPKLQIFDEL